VPFREPNDAKKEATSAIIFIFFGVVLLSIGHFTVAVLIFLLAGNSARLWNAKKQLQRIQDNLGSEISIQEDSATQALSDLLRTTFKDPRATRKKLALASVGLFILLWSWGAVMSLMVAPSRDPGDSFLIVLYLLDFCLYWSLAFSICTQIRRWIAGGALGLSILSWDLTPHSHGPLPPAWTLGVELAIFLATAATFMTLAIVSFIDDEPNASLES
jgi:hypothetical protein